MDTSDIRPYSKLEYISNFLSDPWFIYWIPLISTGILVTVVPFVSNGSYYLSQKFKQWRINQRNKIEGATLITKDQYAEMQTEIGRKDTEFKETLTNRQEDLKTALANIQDYKTRISADATESQKFKVTYAVYGSFSGQWKDVTAYLNNAIIASGGEELSIDVVNERLGVIHPEDDPAHGHWKFLFGTFQFKGKLDSIIAVEQDILKIKNGNVNISKHLQHNWITEAIKAKQDAPETQQAANK